jgi:hypothetical protein
MQKGQHPKRPPDGHPFRKTRVLVRNVIDFAVEPAREKTIGGLLLQTRVQTQGSLAVTLFGDSGRASGIS